MDVGWTALAVGICVAVNAGAQAVCSKRKANSAGIINLRSMVLLQKSNVEWMAKNKKSLSRETGMGMPMKSYRMLDSGQVSVSFLRGYGERRQGGRPGFLGIRE